MYETTPENDVTGPTPAKAALSVLAVAAIMLSIAFPLPIGADTGSHDTSAAERLKTGVALLAAKDLYAANCAGCHGARGKGTEATSVDFSDPQALVVLTRERLDTLLGQGHGAGDRLTGDERAAISGFVRDYLMLPAPDADAELGRAIYARSCSVCHGDRGDAASWAKNSLDPPPADFTAHSLGQVTRKEMIATVTFGSDRTAMMPFATQLDREEIAATVDYIRAAFMSEVPVAAAPGHDTHSHGHASDAREEHHAATDHAAGDVMARAPAPATGDHGIFPGGYVGDPVWGRAFYNDNCAECHGKDGDGEGPRAYFMITKPASFLSRDNQAKLDRTTLFHRIAGGVVGTTMPAWEKVLEGQQIANVGEYVYRAFLHPDEHDVRAPGPSWSPAGAEAPGAKKN